MNKTTLQITSVRDGEVNAMTLLVLGPTLFQAAEALERELVGRRAMEQGDRLVWEIEVEGPDWDYNATGDVTRTRGSDQIGFQKVNFHDGRMHLGDNRRGALSGNALVGVLATNLESQELLKL